MVAVDNHGPTPRKKMHTRQGKPSKPSPSRSVKSPTTSARAARLTRRTQQKESEAPDFYQDHEMASPNVKKPGSDTDTGEDNNPTYAPTTSSKTLARCTLSYKTALMKPSPSPKRDKPEPTLEAALKQSDPTLNSDSAKSGPAPVSSPAPDDETTPMPSTAIKPPSESPYADGAVTLAESSKSPTVPPPSDVEPPELTTPHQEDIPPAASNGTSRESQPSTREAIPKPMQPAIKLAQLPDAMTQLERFVELVCVVHATFRACGEQEQLFEYLDSLQHTLVELRHLIHCLVDPDMRIFREATLVRIRATAQTGVSLANKVTRRLRHGSTMEMLSKLVSVFDEASLLNHAPTDSSDATEDETDGDQKGTLLMDGQTAQAFSAPHKAVLHSLQPVQAVVPPPTSHAQVMSQRSQGVPTPSTSVAPDTPAGGFEVGSLDWAIDRWKHGMTSEGYKFREIVENSLPRKPFTPVTSTVTEYASLPDSEKPTVWCHTCGPGHSQVHTADVENVKPRHSALAHNVPTGNINDTRASVLAEHRRRVRFAFTDSAVQALVRGPKHPGNPLFQAQGDAPPMPATMPATSPIVHTAIAGMLTIGGSGGPPRTFKTPGKPRKRPVRLTAEQLTTPSPPFDVKRRKSLPVLPAEPPERAFVAIHDGPLQPSSDSDSDSTVVFDSSQAPPDSDSSPNIVTPAATVLAPKIPLLLPYDATYVLCEATFAATGKYYEDDTDLHSALHPCLLALKMEHDKWRRIGGSAIIVFVCPFVRILHDSLKASPTLRKARATDQQCPKLTALAFLRQCADTSHANCRLAILVLDLTNAVACGVGVTRLPGDRITYDYLVRADVDAIPFRAFKAVLDGFQVLLCQRSYTWSGGNSAPIFAELATQIEVANYQKTIIKTFFSYYRGTLSHLDDILPVNEPPPGARFYVAPSLPYYTLHPPGYHEECECDAEYTMQYMEKHEYHEVRHGIVDALEQQNELYPIHPCIRDGSPCRQCPCDSCYALRRDTSIDEGTDMAMHRAQYRENLRAQEMLREDIHGDYAEDLTANWWTLSAARSLGFHHLSDECVDLSPCPPYAVLVGPHFHCVFLPHDALAHSSFKSNDAGIHLSWTLVHPARQLGDFNDHPQPMHRFLPEYSKMACPIIDPQRANEFVDLLVDEFYSRLQLVRLLNFNDVSGKLLSTNTRQLGIAWCGGRLVDGNFVPDLDVETHTPHRGLRNDPYVFDTYCDEHGRSIRRYTRASVRRVFSSLHCLLTPNHVPDPHEWARYLSHNLTLDEFRLQGLNRFVVFDGDVEKVPIELAQRLVSAAINVRTRGGGRSQFKICWALPTFYEYRETRLPEWSRHTYRSLIWMHPEHECDLFIEDSDSSSDDSVTVASSETTPDVTKPAFTSPALETCVTSDTQDMDDSTSYFTNPVTREAGACGTQDDEPSGKSHVFTPPAPSLHSHVDPSSPGVTPTVRVHSPSVTKPHISDLPSSTSTRPEFAFMAITTRSLSAAATPRVETVRTPQSDGELIDHPSTGAPGSDTDEDAELSGIASPDLAHPRDSVTTAPTPDDTPLDRLRQGVLSLLTPKNVPGVLTRSATRSRSAPPPPRSSDIRPPTPAPLHAPDLPASDSRIARPTAVPAFVPPVRQPRTVPPFFDPDDEPDPYLTEQYENSDNDTASAASDQNRRPPSVSYLTKVLLKHARNSRLQTLVYPHNLDLRRRKFNAFIDNLAVVCAISSWTDEIFRDWPLRLVYTHANVGKALYNLVFSYVHTECQVHILNLPKDGRSAIFELRRHCAPLTQTYIENTETAFKNLRQQPMEPATSYFSRIRQASRDCQHAGIPCTDNQLLRRAIRGASNHNIYNATYKAFELQIDTAEFRGEEAPTFQSLESHLLDLDERHHITTSHTRHRTAEPSRSGDRRSPWGRSQRVRPSRQPRPQRAYTSQALVCHYCGNSGHVQRDCRRRQSDQTHTGGSSQRSRGGRGTNHNRPSSGQRRPGGSGHRPRDSRRDPSRRAPVSTPPSRHPPRSSNPRGADRSYQPICNACGGRGHYANQCPQRTNRGSSSATSQPRRPQQAFAATKRAQSGLTPSHFEAAFHARTEDDLPRDFLPLLPDLPPDTSDSTYHDDTDGATHSDLNSTMDTSLDQSSGPESPYKADPSPPSDPVQLPELPQTSFQRFGPPDLGNWHPDSGATAHMTPVFEDLVNPTPCNVPVIMADGGETIATSRGDVPSHFHTDCGHASVYDLVSVLFVPGLSHRLVSLVTVSATENHSIAIENRATTLTFPDLRTFTWPMGRPYLGDSPCTSDKSPVVALCVTALDDVQQPAPTSSNPPGPPIPSQPPSEETSTSKTISRATSAKLPIDMDLAELRFAYKYQKTLLAGTLHDVWEDHQIVPSTTVDAWPVKVTVSHKHSRSKRPMPVSPTPFYQIHIDLMRNPHPFGITPQTYFSSYLFIVATPGRLVGWRGTLGESSADMWFALWGWLLETQLLGRVSHIALVRADHGSVFLSADFLDRCTALGMKMEGAAPKHQEMNAVCEAKWKVVHQTANMMLNTARLGNAFFHHAHCYAVEVVNVLPARNVVDEFNLPSTPYAVCYNRKPKISNFRVFGCPVTFKRFSPQKDGRVITNKNQLQKGIRGIFVGFPKNSAGWLVYNAETSPKLSISRDVYFDERFVTALSFDAKPFPGAVPIRSTPDPDEFVTAYSDVPAALPEHVGSVQNSGAVSLSLFQVDDVNLEEGGARSPAAEKMSLKYPDYRDAFMNVEHMPDARWRSLEDAIEAYYDYKEQSDPYHQHRLVTDDDSESDVDNNNNDDEYEYESDSEGSDVQLTSPKKDDQSLDEDSVDEEAVTPVTRYVEDPEPEQDLDELPIMSPTRRSSRQNRGIPARRLVEEAWRAVIDDYEECDEDWSPILDPFQHAFTAIDGNNRDEFNEPIEQYLPEPQTFKAVLMCDPDVRDAWLHAIYQELKNLIDNGTFVLGHEPTEDELVIRTRLVMKAKQTINGLLERLKARIVARGDMEKRRMQKHAKIRNEAIMTQRTKTAEAKERGHAPQLIEIPEPLEDTWSPCASSRGVKLLMGVACKARRRILMADFIGAYLQAKVVGRHFISLPQEYAIYFPQYSQYFGVPLLLNKGVYGMVYSGKRWNQEFSEWLYSQGFVQSTADPSFWVKRYKHGQWLRLIFFIDDMLYVGSNDEVENDFKVSVGSRFNVNFLGEAQWFLQMRIHRYSDGRYSLDQHRFALNTIKRFDKDDDLIKRETPLPPDYVFTLDNRPTTQVQKEAVKQCAARIHFRSAVCTILYLAYNTRADILFAVCKLAKACERPGTQDYRGLMWLLGYLKNKPDLAVCCYPDPNDNPIRSLCAANDVPYSELCVFTDASWQDCPDTGRSTVGYAVFYNVALIEANRMLPVPVAMSSSEAEYLGACSGAMAVAHLRMLLYDMLYLGTNQWSETDQRLPQTPVIILVDNEATVKIARNGRLTRKTRHVERRYHYVKQGQAVGAHELHWVSGEAMVSDILTKTQEAAKIDPQILRMFIVLPEHMTRK